MKLILRLPVSSDVRAATPSMAGELVVPVKAELVEMLIKKREAFPFNVYTFG